MGRATTVSILLLAILASPLIGETLNAGSGITREISSGEKHEYDLALGAGEFVRVVAEPDGVDVSLAASTSDGRELGKRNHADELYLAESVSLVSDSAASIMMTVQAEGKGRKGRYTIRLLEQRPAVPQDQDRVAAERKIDEAERLRDQRTKEGITGAIERFQSALALARGIDDSRLIAETLEGMGGTLAFLGDFKNAADFLQQALTVARSNGDKVAEAATLNDLGFVYNRLGDRSKAIAFLQSAPELPKNPQLQAAIANNLGAVYAEMGDSQKAVDLSRKVLALRRSMGDRGGEAYALNNLGVMTFYRGDFQLAVDYYRQGLVAFRDAGNAAGAGAALLNLGIIYLNWRKEETALDYFRQTIDIARATGARNLEAEGTFRIGSTYLQLRDPEQALPVLLEAFQLFTATGDKTRIALLQTALGRTYALLGKPDKALTLYNAGLQLNIEVGQRMGAAHALYSIAESLLESGQAAEAIGCFNEAREMFESVANPIGQAGSRHGLARAYGATGQLDAARREIDGALNLAENLRATVVSPDSRATYFESIRGIYEYRIDLLMQLHRQDPQAGYDAMALQTSERARARSLVDMLSESRAEIRQGVDPALLRRERELQEDLSSKLNQQTRLLSRTVTPEQKQAAARQIDSLQAEYERVEEEIRRTSPRYASLTQPQSLSLAEIQKLLDDETVLLEYSLGDERSFLWAVTRTQLRSYELPNRKEIESLASAVYEGFSRRGDVFPVVLKAASALASILLGPVSRDISGKRLFIVADGSLQYVPFAALPLPSSVSEIVMSRHEVVNAPSASSLALLRADAAARKTPPKLLAIFADPVFEKDDERVVSSHGGARRVADEDLTRAAVDVGVEGGRFARLPFTRREANAILTIVPPEKRKAALDFEANRRAALSPELAEYRTIHFATHALLDARRPELSGIVLSLVDREGNEQDGFIAAPELFNLNLPADLVVLSGCRTALGKDVRGEGLVGLTRGFMYAGATRVVASLWKVDDAATADLMREFYAGMFGPKKLRPAAALRAAQQSVAGESRWAAPYYWAAFVLQGEWQ